MLACYWLPLDMDPIARHRDYVKTPGVSMSNISSPRRLGIGLRLCSPGILTVCLMKNCSSNLFL